MTLSVELSGLQAAQTDLDTIGNNVANVNTAGFKGSAPNFADLYGASLSGAGGPVLGEGVTTNSVSQLFTEGAISQTGNPLDVAISGNGFLQVKTQSGVAYTRDGALQISASGYLVNDTGAQIMGFAPPASGSQSSVASGPLSPIHIDESNISPTATANLGMNLNLPSSDTAINTTTTPFSISNPASYNESSTTAVYDSLGVSRTLTTYFTQVSGSGSPPQWQTHWQLSDSSGNAVASGAGPTLTFNSSGTLTAGAGTITVASLPDGAAPLSISESFSGSSLSDLSFGINSTTNDGSGGGQYSGLQIGSDGSVVAQYSNGATKVMGTIALANFINPQGLTAISGNNWVPSLNSGPAVTNAPGTAGMGVLQAGELEGSNVDLSTQLADLIVAQQAYQANVQSINVDQQDVQRLLTLQ